MSKQGIHCLCIKDFFHLYFQSRKGTFPKVLSDKFTPKGQNPFNPILEDSLDEELVDQGDDDDKQEYLEAKFAEDVNFIKNIALEVHENHFHEDHFQKDEIPVKPCKEVMDLDSLGVSRSKQIQEAKPSNLPVSCPTSTTIKRSDKNKKPSTRWNEEVGFLPHPPKSTNEKNSRRSKGRFAFFKLFNF